MDTGLLQINHIHVYMYIIIQLFQPYWASSVQCSTLSWPAALGILIVKKLSLRLLFSFNKLQTSHMLKHFWTCALVQLHTAEHPSWKVSNSNRIKSPKTDPHGSTCTNSEMYSYLFQFELWWDLKMSSHAPAREQREFSFFLHKRWTYGMG